MAPGIPLTAKLTKTAWALRAAALGVQAFSGSGTNKWESVPGTPSARVYPDGVRPGNSTSVIERDPLDWSIVKKKTGETRWQHLQKHGVADPARPGLHGVFDSDPVLSTQEAWYRAQRLGIKPTADGTYVVPMGRRIGWESGAQGTGQALENITIHTVDGNKVITAYPSR